MAEYVLSVVGAILDKMLPLAADEISRLWGLNEDLQKLAGKLEMMQALISDAQSKPITSKVMQLWLKRLQSIAGDAEIVKDDFEYEVLRQKVEKRKRKRKRDMVRDLFSRNSSNPALNHLELANKIKDIISSLEDVYKEANQIGLHPAQLLSQIGHHPAQINQDRLTDPFVVESEIVGREDDVYQVVSMLVSSDYKKDLPVISVVGMAGQGKTTLAQVVLKDDRVMKYFEKRIWVCVSDDFKVGRLLNEMLQSLGGTNAETTNREALVRMLRESLERKRYLLVLDDLWNENREKWDCMRKCLVAIGGSQGSKILATTRSDHVASAIQTSCLYRLGVLSDDDSWMLFEKLAFVDGGARKTRDLVDIGRRILKRCGGVPLAIKAIGGVLYSMKEQSEWLMIEKSKWNQTSSIGDAVFSTLKLSYDHLPSFLVKQCFASCSIFPKDTRMQKERLIEIWMAQGLINHSKGGDLEIEEIGSNYFNILLRSSLLQDPERDIFNDIISCKMHDLVHDLSLQVSNNGFFNTEDGTIKNLDNEVKHLTLLSSEGKVLKNMEGIPPKLQTLYLVGDHAVLENIFKTCRYLYILIVEYCWGATNLPNAIGDMKHLRYLDIVRTGITTLPDSITKLYKLMTLRVRKLRVIPNGFGNLINLRHFYIAEEAPLLIPGIGQFANLRTLSYFMVGQDEGCQIEELGRLPNLKGELNISGLENVSSKESAAEAKLSRKSNIQRLGLRWKDKRNDFGENVIDVVEGFQPHSNLKSLTIVSFKGWKLPSWMVVLHNLVKIRLECLDKCEEVPPFGHLRHLQILEMVILPNVKRIGSEFYGLETLDYPSCSREGQAVNSFPALKELNLWFMHGLVEWSDAKIPTDSSSWIKVFPKLQKLDMDDLPKLAILPDMENFTRLEELNMHACGSLTCIRNLNSLTSLRSLDIEDCPNLDATDLDMNILRSLRLEGCEKLVSSLRSLNNLTLLEDLKIFSYAASWPKDLDHPPNLRSLKLGCFYEDLDYFPWPFSVISSMTSTKDSAVVMKQQQQHFVSLETLDLRGGPKITSLPEQIQHLPALRNLSISRLGGLEGLPDWLGCLQNLEYLEVDGCSNLNQLPSVEAIQRLTNLRKLDIRWCPHLRDPHWPKDAGFPPFHIYP